MSILDLQNNDNPRGSHTVLGPLPVGSRVLLRVTLADAWYPVEGFPLLTKSRKGIAQLPVGVEVASGRYAGYHWYERITVPERFQRIEMNDGQRFSCKVGNSILVSILQSAHGIAPGTDDDRLHIQSWECFNGLVFPAKLDIDQKPIMRGGKRYWRNCIKYVLPVTDPDYRFIMNGGEYISKGPVSWDA